MTFSTCMTEDQGGKEKKKKKKLSSFFFFLFFRFFFFFFIDLGVGWGGRPMSVLFCFVSCY